MSSGVRVSLYDLECVREFSYLHKKLEKHFFEVKVDCPYQLPYIATFYQGLFGPLSDRVMELFLSAGYRRNGNTLYSMKCEECRACIPIRLEPKKFKASRSQKRIWKKNSDLDISFGLIKPSLENMTLCNQFLKQRYPVEGNNAETYYAGFFLNKITPTYEIRYRLNGKLIGNGIVDLGNDWLNAVYFFFDPKEANRSLGIFNILTLIKFCLKKDIPFLYLGYTIDELSSMNYKTRFNPHFLHKNSLWYEGK